MGDAGLYGHHRDYHALRLYQGGEPGIDALGTIENSSHHPRPLGRIPHDSMQDNEDGAHHGTNRPACLVVSRHLRDQPHVPQPRPYLRRMGTGPLWMPARPALCQGVALGGGERTDVDGLLHVLSDDSSSGALLFLLQILRGRKS